MTSEKFILRIKAHMKNREHLMAMLDKAIDKIGHEQLARALIDKEKVFGTQTTA